MKRVALYRHFDSAGRLLYVGVSTSVMRRTQEHARQAVWSGDIAEIKAEWFDSAEAAGEAERRAIREESPLHNIVHAQAGADRHDMADRLRQARVSRDLTQKQLADAVGVSVQAVSHWEKRRSSLLGENLLLLAGALGVSPYWLAFGTDSI